jgi:hypothetical protein
MKEDQLGMADRGGRSLRSTVGEGARQQRNREDPESRNFWAKQSAIDALAKAYQATVNTM